MLCSKCGREVPDELLFCPNCGASTTGFVPPQKNEPHDTLPYEAQGQRPYVPPQAPSYGQPYAQPSANDVLSPALRAYCSEAQLILVFGIASLVTFLGIGLIFEILNMVKLKKLSFYDPAALRSPYEAAQYHDAQKKLQLGRIFTIVAMVLTGLVLLIWLIAIMAMIIETSA